VHATGLPGTEHPPIASDYEYNIRSTRKKTSFSRLKPPAHGTIFRTGFLTRANKDAEFSSNLRLNPFWLSQEIQYEKLYRVPMALVS